MVNQRFACCGLCHYFYYLGDGNGSCRRKRPLAFPMPNGLLTVFPSISSDQWCGEYLGIEVEDKGLSPVRVAPAKMVTPRLVVPKHG